MDKPQSGSIQELFDFMLHKLGGEQMVKSEFLKTKIASLDTRQKTVGDLIKEAEQEGWNDWLESLKLAEFAELITQPERRIKVAPIRVGKRLTPNERDGLYNKILDYLRENPWSLSSSLSDLLGLPTRTVGLHLKTLREQGKVKTEGEKAKMRYALA